ncbi:succinate dehydrogenase, cytochrome b556 subunit [Sphingomonas histidinilytica]|uniref:Succinate dehydrogenase cytochrome b556 subunit n=1 Tax=Rhizorhabdus histidinilytica TaxID=439228 RepID=A0A1T5C1C8_9SPHN|nr:succinate dehydrogenase, cytochrome b556 subunit [Rhizorhabdus histidinilytica]MBO9375273.1 succinate dehydrogenase, cytochrome b556 subunit [Rhizorhabdus histidinilytica]SKB52960.1 succinate dehydrogenase subunit C [Rhizorhabdus histidinilytica]
MSRNPGRPLSPHLTIWKWGPHMAVSILHRATGVGLAIVAGLAFVWWLVAAASGPDAYAAFYKVATSWFGYLVAIGLTWSFFQHLFSGLRHFVLDIGAGYELKVNKTGSIATMVGSVLVTLLIWVPILLSLSKGAN